MKIASERNGVGLGGIVISHDGLDLSFPTKEYDKTKLKSSPDMLYTHINDFFSKLAVRRQREIFFDYENIHRILYSARPGKILEQVMKAVEQLYRNITYNEINYYVTKLVKNNQIVIPSTVNETYQNTYSKEETYIVDDYIELLTLVLMIRPMLPIWSVYMLMLKGSEHNAFKEKTVKYILYKTDIPNTPGYLKLEEYIKPKIDNMDISLSASFDGLASVEVPDWVLSLLLVRKLAVAELGRDDNLAAFLFKHVSNILQNDLNERFSDNVENKPSTAYDASDDESKKEGMFEACRVKEEIAPSLLYVYDMYIEEYQYIIEKVDPTIPSDLVNACIAHWCSGVSTALRPFQVDILIFTLSRGINPNVYQMLEGRALAISIGLAQAYLCHWGFNDLAATLTASCIETEGAGVTESSSRISRSYVDELIDCYKPHCITSTRDPEGRQTNQGVVAINLIAKKASDYSLEPNHPDVVDYNGRLLPPEFKNRLALLLLHVIKM